MKKRIITIGTLTTLTVTALTAVGYSGNASAASGTANATATIQTAINIGKDSSNTISTTGGDLAFGTIVPDAVGGTVLISASNNARSNGTGSLVFVSKGTNGSLTDYGAAVFLVTGAISTSYAITLPTAPTTITSAGNTMSVDAWTGSATSLTTSVIGESNFKVGGTLHVAASQKNGTYTGTFDVTVAYN